MEALVETLIAKIASLEARLDDTVSYNSERVNCDIKEFIVSNAHRGVHEPFIGVYHAIPRLHSLEKLTITVTPNNPIHIPEIHKIHNAHLTELIISEGCKYIPYLVNFPSLKRLEIVSDLNHFTYVGTASGYVKTQRRNEFQDLSQNIPARRQKISEYCIENGIELICK